MTFVVKAQLSIVTTAAEQQIFIYNKARTLTVQRSATEHEVKLFNGRMKVYAIAERIRKRDDIRLLRLIPDQDF